MRIVFFLLLLCTSVKRGGLSTVVESIFRPMMFPTHAFNSKEEETWIYRHRKKVGIEMLNVPGGYGRVPYVHLKAPRSKWTIIVSHGNVANIRTMLGIADQLRKMSGSDVMLYEYPGYPGATPKSQDPSEGGILAAITAAFNHVKKTREVHRIALLGLSIGATPSMYLAAQKKHIGALIIQGAVASAYGVFFQKAKAPWLLRDSVDVLNSEKIAEEIKTPTFIMHGDNDTIVPVSQASTLAAAIVKHAPVTNLELTDGGHMPPAVLISSVTTWFLQDIEDAGGNYGGQRAHEVEVVRMTEREALKRYRPLDVSARISKAVDAETAPSAAKTEDPESSAIF